MKNKLKDYGFPDFAIEGLMKGKDVRVNYGTIKLNRKTGVLTTVYDNGKKKIETL